MADGKIFTTGFSKMSERQLGLWDLVWGRAVTHRAPQDPACPPGTLLRPPPSEPNSCTRDGSAPSRPIPVPRADSVPPIPRRGSLPTRG